MDEELKAKLLKLLKEDEEFRYAVAGYIGLEEVLRELADLRRRSEAHDRKFNEILERLDEHDRKFNEVLERLDEHDRKFNEVILELRELRKSISEVQAYIERTSLTLEEEAREVIGYRLRRSGVQVKLEPLVKPELEINIYGATGDICVVGEVSTRAGVRVVSSLDKKVDELQRRYPEYLRPKVIKVIYVLWATEEAIEEAKRRNIWLIKSTEELTPLKVMEYAST